jgi:hypothetical protein
LSWLTIVRRKKSALIRLTQDREGVSTADHETLLNGGV